jgi:hypothetical protein
VAGRLQQLYINTEKLRWSIRHELPSWGCCTRWQCVGALKQQCVGALKQQCIAASIELAALAAASSNIKAGWLASAEQPRRAPSESNGVTASICSRNVSNFCLEADIRKISLLDMHLR